MYYVYLIKSEKRDEIYVGSTNDLKRRLNEHNNGLSISTKRYMPWKLIYYEAYRIEADARNREAGLKNHGNALRELGTQAESVHIDMLWFESDRDVIIRDDSGKIVEEGKPKELLKDKHTHFHKAYNIRQ